MKTHQLPEMQQQRPLSPSYFRHLNAGTRENITRLIPDIVLPEQFYSPPRRAARTHWHTALMRAVLTDAIECYQYQSLANGQHWQRLAKEAETWLFSDDESGPFAFVNVCAALSMEPTYVRRGLTRLRQSSSTDVDHQLRPLSPVRRLPRHVV